MAFQDYFSLVAFFIFLRETLEAAVIIAVLLQCMNRTAPRLKRQVWWGAATGIIGSVIAGGVFAAVYYVASTTLFQGNGKLIFQGCISYLACILITYLGFAMLRFANIEQKYMRKLDGAARTALEKAKASNAASTNRSHSWSVFILAATAVLREGIESVIFLAGVGAQSSFKAIPLACLAGLVVGLAVGFIIYYGGHTISNLKVFFVISTVMLFFIAAGQVSMGTQLFSKVGMFGPYAAWEDELAWQVRPVADLTHCCSDEMPHGNQFFVLAHAVVGFQAKPTPVILILYCFYWAVVILTVFLKWRNGSLFDADYKRKRTLLKLSRNVSSTQRNFTRCTRSIGSLEGKIEAAAAAGTSTAALEQKLATKQQQQADLQKALAAAEAAKKEEADRLEKEDEELAERQAAAAAAAAAAKEPTLPVVADRGSDAASSESGTPSSSAAALVGVDDAVDSKDVEAAVGGAKQQQKKGGGVKGLFAKLRKD